MSVTGQVGHVALAVQTAFGTPNTTGTAFKAVRITGDSVASNNNQLVAEGEIGSGRDVTQSVMGGYSAQGAINGNLTARAAAAFLRGVLGTLTAVPGDASHAAIDEFTPADTLPVFTVEKKVGTTGNQLLVLQYSDVMVNTLNVSVNSGGLSTFSAGIIAATEQQATSNTPVAGETYPATSSDLLVWHGGRVRVKDSTDADTVTFASGDDDTSFQSVEVAINNNVDASEYTIRPSRFLRSLTEGIRSVETNMTIVFDDYHKYTQYTYGAASATQPGYKLYVGAFDIQLANWQLADADAIQALTPTGAPANPQGIDITIPKLAFSAFPVQLSSGRIAVSTTARALKPTTGNIIKVDVRPTGAAF